MPDGRHERYKEVFCSDCQTVLGRYSTKYFSDQDINELVRIHHATHIKQGHMMTIRLAGDL